MEPIVYILVFVATLLAIEGVLLIAEGRRTGRRAKAVRRLRRLARELQAPHTTDDGTLLRSGLEPVGLIKGLYQLIPGRRALEVRLYRAGWTTTPGRLVLISGALGGGAFLAGMILWKDPVVGLGLACVGFAPWIQAGRVANKRMNQFEEQFPEALELMTRALRAGHSLTFAFQLVGDEMPDPIGREFAHVCEEIKLGQELRVALANLTYRINAGDLPYFTTAVMVQRETGGNLAELLDNLGYVIRDRFKLFGKVRSLTAVGKATANILGVWPILMVLLLKLVGADFVSLLWKTQEGHVLSACAAALVVLGYVLCRRSAEIRV